MLTSLMSLTMTRDAPAFAVVEDVVHQRGGLTGAEEAGKYGDGQIRSLQGLGHGRFSERDYEVGGVWVRARA